jgi:ribose-phosphate pyrophosphokinase
MARRFARRRGGGFALADKTRSGHDEDAEVFGLLGDVAGRDAVLRRRLHRNGRNAGRGRRAAGRAWRPLSDRRRDARPLLRRRNREDRGEPIERVIVTDTVENQPQPLGDKVEVVSVAALFAEAIKRIHGRESISVLFRE